jgi:surfeit locus 1 family protein
VTRRVQKAGAAFGALLLFCGFIALGTWQVERRAWKLNLIARVAERAYAAPVAAPPFAEWPGVSAAKDEYRRIRATGIFLYEAETQVLAVTDLGSGYWVLTPLKLEDGSVVLVNRGFVAADRRDNVAHAAVDGAGITTIGGLLRITEPGGAFLRHNDPAANRWYSRDVGAIAAARHLDSVAPYFIDADVQPSIPGAPVGGLTVIAFHNNHLVYAITWYTLALMIPAAIWVGIREERRRRRPPAGVSPEPT